MRKPDSIAQSEALSARWDALVSTGRYSDSDAPLLEMLVRWLAIGDAVTEAMQDEDGELDPRIQDVTMLRQASAEVRSIERQLGDRAQAARPEQKGELALILGKREERRRAAGGA